MHQGVLVWPNLEIYPLREGRSQPPLSHHIRGKKKFPRRKVKEIKTIYLTNTLEEHNNAK